MVKLSVIVPVYKIDVSYLEKCINSLMDQSLQEMEVILVDDGSPDNCGLVCDQYAKKDKRIVAIHQKNQGVSVARNAGIKVAVGEYIMFVDSDDWVEVNTFDKIYNYVSKTKPEILLFGYASNFSNSENSCLYSKNLVFSQDDIEILQLSILNSTEKFYKLCPASPWSKLFKREFVIKNNLEFVPGLKRMQDNVFCMNAFNVAENVIYFNYLGYHYRINSSSACNRPNKQVVATLEAAMDQLEIVNYHNEEYFREAIDFKFVDLLLGEYMNKHYRHIQNGLTRKKAIELYTSLIKQKKYRNAIKNVHIFRYGRRYAFYISVLKLRCIRLLWFAMDMENKIRNRIFSNEKMLYD